MLKLLKNIFTKKSNGIKPNLKDRAEKKKGNVL